MPTDSPSPRFADRMRGALVPLLVLAVGLGLYIRTYWRLLNGHAHPIGADFSYFLPRLVAMEQWFKVNGPWATPWFTPAFCGGLPAYANPQAMPYSLPQLLVAYVDPVTAVQLTMAILVTLGALGFYVLLRRNFETSRPAALVGAFLFLFNGFYGHRLVVGHFAFHPMMLTPWVAFFITRRERSRWQLVVDSVAAGVLLALMIQGGMLVILPPLGAAIFALGILQAMRWGGLLANVGRLVLGLAWAVALCATRLVATGALMRHFNRDFYDLPGVERVGTLLAITFRSVFFRADAETWKLLTKAAVKLDVHEWEYGLTPVALILLAVGGLVFASRQARRVDLPRVPYRVWLMVVLAIVLLLPLAFNFYTPAWNATLKQIPILKSSNTLIRWFVVYLPVLAAMAALALDRLPGPASLRVGAAAVSLVGIVAYSLTGQASIYSEQHYDAVHMLDAWRTLHTQGSLPDVQYMDTAFLPNGMPHQSFQGDDIFAVGGGQITCYEPLFGYQMEKFPIGRLHVGLALEARNGHFNIKNPVCYLYPELNHCEPGDEFTADQQEQADAFVSYAPFPFRMPVVQKLAAWVSALATAGAIGVLLAGLLRRGRRA